jgi:hypothetical protein
MRWVDFLSASICGIQFVDVLPENARWTPQRSCSSDFLGVLCGDACHIPMMSVKPDAVRSADTQPQERAPANMDACRDLLNNVFARV